MTESEPEQGSRRAALALEAARRELLIREAVRFSLIAGGGLAVLAALLVSAALATSIVLGTLLASINFVLLARGIANAIDRTVAEIERAKAEQGIDSPDAPVDPDSLIARPRSASSFLRTLFFFGVLFGLIRYPPAEPMGLAVGVLVVLIAVSFASYRDHLRRREAIRAPKA